MPANELNFRKKAYVQVGGRRGWHRAPGCHAACWATFMAAGCWPGKLPDLGHCAYFHCASWQELNGFIGLKKAYTGGAAARAELLDGAKSESQQLAGGCWQELLRGSWPPLWLCVRLQQRVRRDVHTRHSS